MFYDVVIIGAGPAGASAGYWLAQAGVKTALVDRSSFPREKLCGGLLTSKTVDMLRTILLAEDMPRYGVTATHVFYNDQPTASFQLLSEAYTVRRLQFDAALVTAAEKQGVHPYLGASLQTIDFTRKEACLSDGHRLQYSTLIGADGALSTVRRLAGLPRNEMGFCVESHVPWELLKNHDRIQTGGIEIYYGNFSAGYGWIFPCEDSVAVGVGNLAQSMSGKEILAQYHRFLADVLTGDGMRPAGAYLPSGTSIALGTPLCEDMCLIGDAAGLIDPFTGEGIYYALLSGKMASEAIITGRPPRPEYERRMKRHISMIRDTVQIRNRIYSPAVLKHSLDFMRTAAGYSEQLIDETIVRYAKTYTDAYEEIKYYSR